MLDGGMYQVHLLVHGLLDPHNLRGLDPHDVQSGDCGQVIHSSLSIWRVMIIYNPRAWCLADTKRAQC